MSKSHISRRRIESANYTVGHMKNTQVDRAEMHKGSTLVEVKDELAADQDSSIFSSLLMSRSQTSQR